MQISAVNRRAQQNYATFVAALDLVAEQFDEIDKLIDRVDDRKAAGGFTIATKDELQGLRRKAFDELDRMRTAAKKYEAELVSRDWRL
ncbi:hypothetical protein ABZ863_23490 [Saccharomonospora sp. NPDC046836]|uniref:hypothetical protein n=1 Tax=Saccharomonospora sp. NPDC046836 TaxID=3156921 RepID=UPI0033D0CC59